MSNRATILSLGASNGQVIILITLHPISLQRVLNHDPVGFPLEVMGKPPLDPCTHMHNISVMVSFEHDQEEWLAFVASKAGTSQGVVEIIGRAARNRTAAPAGVPSTEDLTWILQAQKGPVH